MSGKKKSTTEGSSTSTATTHHEVPDWIKTPTMGLAGQIGDVISQGPGAFTPGISDLQQKAFEGAMGLENSAWLGKGGNVLEGIGDIEAERIAAASLLEGGLDKYYNPFKEQVLNPVLGDYDVQSGITRAAQAAGAARGKAFQGSRYGIQEGQTEGELARGRSAAEGGLLNTMYGQAITQAEADAARRQAAAQSNQQAALQAAMSNQSTALQKAQGMIGLGLASGAESRANLGLQAGLGSQATELENIQKQYPLTFLAQGGTLLNQLNPQLYSDTTVNQSGTSKQTQITPGPGLLEGLGMAAQIGSLFLGPAGAATGGAGLLKGLMG